MSRCPVGFMSIVSLGGHMARPEIDDDLIHKLGKIIDEMNDIPLPADELSVNQQFRLVVDSLHQEVQNTGPSEELYLFYDSNEDEDIYTGSELKRGENL